MSVLSRERGGGGGCGGHSPVSMDHEQKLALKGAGAGRSMESWAPWRPGGGGKVQKESAGRSLRAPIHCWPRLVKTTCPPSGTALPTMQQGESRSLGLQLWAWAWLSLWHQKSEPRVGEGRLSLWAMEGVRNPGNRGWISGKSPL